MINGNEGFCLFRNAHIQQKHSFQDYKNQMFLLAATFFKRHKSNIHLDRWSSWFYGQDTEIFHPVLYLSVSRRDSHFLQEPGKQRRSRTTVKQWDSVNSLKMYECRENGGLPVLSAEQQLVSSLGVFLLVGLEHGPGLDDSQHIPQWDESPHGNTANSVVSVRFIDELVKSVKTSLEV